MGRPGGSGGGRADWSRSGPTPPDESNGPPILGTDGAQLGRFHLVAGTDTLICRTGCDAPGVLTNVVNSGVTTNVDDVVGIAVVVVIDCVGRGSILITTLFPVLAVALVVQLPSLSLLSPLRPAHLVRVLDMGVVVVVVVVMVVRDAPFDVLFDVVCVVVAVAAEVVVFGVIVVVGVVDVVVDVVVLVVDVVDADRVVFLVVNL